MTFPNSFQKASDDVMTRNTAALGWNGRKRAWQGRNHLPRITPPKSIKIHNFNTCPILAYSENYKLPGISIGSKMYLSRTF